jgi:inorganic pyrophosphatase/exopolyphosphatase
LKSGSQQVEIDLEFLFEFVKRPHLEKYNKQETLAKEEKIKDETQSQCLVTHSSHAERPCKLEDFKIIKVIDKGSFGKVFLVANKFTG